MGLRSRNAHCFHDACYILPRVSVVVKNFCTGYQIIHLFRSVYIKNVFNQITLFNVYAENVFNQITLFTPLFRPETIQSKIGVK